MPGFFRVFIRSVPTTVILTQWGRIAFEVAVFSFSFVPILKFEKLGSVAGPVIQRRWEDDI